MQGSFQITPDTPAQPPMVAPEGVVGGVEQNGDRISGSVRVPAPDPNSPLSPAGDAGNRPAWLPEKFKSAEDLAKSYAELEKAFHTRSNPAATPAAAAPAAGAPTIKAAPATPAAEAGKPVLSDAAKELAESGTVSEETYTKLAEAGHDRATVDTFVAGQKALAQQLRADIATVAGGEEQLNAVLEWAGKHLPAQAIEAYNAAAASGNVELIKLSLQGVVASYRTAVPAEPRLISGTPAPSHGDNAPFQSNEQMVAAMRDPRYQTDPAYRNQIAARLAASMR
jgi:hypothetical protein